VALEKVAGSSPVGHLSQNGLSKPDTGEYIRSRSSWGKAIFSWDAHRGVDNSPTFIGSQESSCHRRGMVAHS
jgi:hypothetical protein